ncbi:protein of unknown function DUF1007 [Thioalkalivibrio nitratireducens DSM 14787]|uniref:DUF1007 family protein n=1 Tax=Thioalkalivibrio nitratireducens (strain DSM 14787 / UNIQEM 213 / ALEN2) TaxID=1255043 RepID=L0DSF7_THIND|nr:DUF1007 family protein [Thioalkalivibrio nitratireducens]AGA31933.1 protein of unknown function DUF1007 [Thioalkalivibrio nitratireducens DSM 14787]
MTATSEHRQRRGKPGARLSALLLGIVAWACLLPPLQAHPHAWIDLDIELEADTEDRVVAMAQTWVMDPLYSRYLYDDAMEQFEGDTPEAKLAGLGAEILDNLAEYDWYTDIRAGDHRIRARPDGGAELVLQDGRLRFRFRLALDQAVDPRARQLRYRIYDPTYFIEVLHDTDTPPRLELSTGSCHMEVQKPRPDPVVVARALALDYGQTGEPDLGRHFAEHVTVRCD